jgi:hypothetical protein
MRRIILSSVACLIVQYFSTLSYKRQHLVNIKRVFRFSLQVLSETFLILGRIRRDSIKNVRTSHVKCPLFLSDFNET